MKRTVVKRAVTGFEPDAEGHWTARLACGHRQHVRHDPPLVARPWVLTSAGRESRLGQRLECKKCERGEPPDFTRGSPVLP
jgi:hypothetical protein